MSGIARAARRPQPSNWNSAALLRMMRDGERAAQARQAARIDFLKSKAGKRMLEQRKRPQKMSEARRSAAMAASKNRSKKELNKRRARSPERSIQNRNRTVISNQNVRNLLTQHGITPPATIRFRQNLARLLHPNRSRGDAAQRESLAQLFVLLGNRTWPGNGRR